MRVLVTGGAGFIGSNLVRYLANHRPNWELVVVDLLTYAGNLENIASLIADKRITFVKADIAEESQVAPVFGGRPFDLVFNLAAESHVDRSILSAAEFVRTNVLGTQVLLDLSLKHKASRFLQISTDEVYGSLGPTGAFVESTPLDPSSPYSASKAGADLLVMAYQKTHKADVIVTRCTNNYGPYQFPEKFIPLFITNAMHDKPLPLYGDGMNVRSWLYVDDHCEALLMAAEKGKSGEVYNIGGAQEAELTNKFVCETLLKLLSKPASLIKYVDDRPAHDRRYAIDYSKSKRELGWQPRTSFEAGLAKTLDWYKSNQDWWQKIKSGEYRNFYEKQYGSRI